MYCDLCVDNKKLITVISLILFLDSSVNEELEIKYEMPKKNQDKY